MLVIFIIVISGCTQSRHPDYVILDYSYDNGWTKLYSLKLYDSGVAYMKRDNLDTAKFYTRAGVTVSEVSDIISHIQKTRLKRKYEDKSLSDAPTFKVIVRQNSEIQSEYYVYGEKYPKILKNIKRIADEIIEGSGWRELNDTTVKFSSSIKYIHPVDTNIRFLPPKLP